MELPFNANEQDDTVSEVSEWLNTLVGQILNMPVVVVGRVERINSTRQIQKCRVQLKPDLLYYFVARGNNSAHSPLTIYLSLTTPSPLSEPLLPLVFYHQPQVFG